MSAAIQPAQQCPSHGANPDVGAASSTSLTGGVTKAGLDERVRRLSISAEHRTDAMALTREHIETGKLSPTQIGRRGSEPKRQVTEGKVEFCERLILQLEGDLKAARSTSPARQVQSQTSTDHALDFPEQQHQPNEERVRAEQAEARIEQLQDRVTQLEQDATDHKRTFDYMWVRFVNASVERDMFRDASVSEFLRAEDEDQKGHEWRDQFIDERLMYNELQEKRQKDKAFIRPFVDQAKAMGDRFQEVLDEFAQYKVDHP